MRIDLQIPESWLKVGEIYRQALGLQNDPLVSLQPYLGPRHAVWEICQALAQTFPHRKTIAYVPTLVPEAEPLMLALSREGFVIKTLAVADLANAKALLEPLQKELLFVLTSVDDPVTGELHETPELNEFLKDKRAFKIVLSHFQHRFKPITKPALYDIRICSIERDLALAILGERGRFQPPLSSQLHWSTPAPESATAAFALVPDADQADWKKRIEAFEANPPKGARPFFAPGARRLYDRAALVFDDIDGLALVTELGADLKVALNEPGTEAALETASLCRWENAKALEWWFAKGHDPRTARGLVLISAKLLADASLKQKIEAAHARVLQAQNG